MTTTPGEGPSIPDQPGDIAPERDSWGCVWWWWLIIIFILLVIWWGGWGLGRHGGWWRRGPSTNQASAAFAHNDSSRALSKSLCRKISVLPPKSLEIQMAFL